MTTFLVSVGVEIMLFALGVDNIIIDALFAILDVKDLAFAVKVMARADQETHEG